MAAGPAPYVSRIWWRCEFSSEGCTQLGRRSGATGRHSKNCERKKPTFDKSDVNIRRLLVKFDWIITVIGALSSPDLFFRTAVSFRNLTSYWMVTWSVIVYSVRSSAAGSAYRFQETKRLCTLSGLKFVQLSTDCCGVNSNDFGLVRYDVAGD